MRTSRRDPETGATPTDQGQARDDSERDGGHVLVPEPEPCKYEGPPIDDLRESKSADRSLVYHAVVEAFCEGYAGVLNWRLEGAAAALGQREGRTAAEIVADLRGDERGSGSVSYDRKTPGRVEYDYSRAARGEFSPASWETLGMLHKARRRRSPTLCLAWSLRSSPIKLTLAFTLTPPCPATLPLILLPARSRSRLRPHPALSTTYTPSAVTQKQW